MLQLNTFYFILYSFLVHSFLIIFPITPSMAVLKNFLTNSLQLVCRNLWKLSYYMYYMKD